MGGDSLDTEGMDVDADLDAPAPRKRANLSEHRKLVVTNLEYGVNDDDMKVHSRLLHFFILQLHSFKAHANA